MRKEAEEDVIFKSKPEYNKYDIGDYTYSKVGPTIFSWNDETKLKIGKFCSLAEEVVFILGGEHRADWITTYPFNALLMKEHILLVTLLQKVIS